MKKENYLSIVAASVLVTNAFALDIDLNTGWNAVGVSSVGDYDISKIIDTSKVESIIKYSGNTIESYDPLKPKYSDFTTLSAGKGYWVKVKSDTILSIGDTPISLSSITFNTGWNLLGVPSMDIADISSSLSTKDMKLDSVIAYSGSSIESYDPSKPKYSDFSATVDGKGYWFKISKKLTDVTTLDGYKVTLYSSASESMPSTLLDTIKSSTLSELTSIPDWKNVTSVVVGSGSKTKELATTSIASVDMGSVKSELSGSTAATASLYIQGVSEGSAPYALVDALVYKVDGSTTTLIGKTDESGFITAPALTSGTKLLIKKDGMSDKIYTIDVAGTNYIYMSDDNALELPSEKASDGSARVLEYVSETFKRKGSVGYYSPSSEGSLLKDLPTRKIKPTTIDTLDESDQLRSLIEAKAKEGYKSDILASFDFYLKMFGMKGYGDFSDYYSTKPFITVALPDVDGYELADALAGKGGNVRVFYFDGSSWKEKSSADINVTTVNDEVSKIKKSYGKKFDLETPVLQINGTGFYPHVIVLDKKVSFTYPVKFHVTSDDANLSGVAISMGDRLVGVTDKDGYFDYNVTAGFSDVNFHVKAMKPDYKSSDKTVYISSLSKDAPSTVELKLEKISTTASVEGFVYDTNETNPVYMGKVDLYFPYALAYVKAVNEKGRKGIEVGNQPNTKYKWYMKIHEDASSLPPLGSARVSKERWLEVKEGSSSDKGNFLSYQDMKRMIVDAKDSSDPEDVKSMVSGLFDVAVIAEHDIDGDGTPDLVELSATKDSNGTDFTSAYSSDTEIDDYAKIVGTVKFNFDVEKFKEGISIDEDIAPAVKVDGVWSYGSDDADDTSSYESNVTDIDPFSDDDADFSLEIKSKYFTYKGLDETTIQANGDYTLKYGVGLMADLTTDDSDGKTVALVKDTSGKLVWKKVAIDDDYELYAKLYDMNASMTIGQKVWDAKTHSYTVFDGKIPYSKISKFISQNEIMEKLNMTLGDIADEAGSTAVSDDDRDKPLISTGMTIVPMVDLHAKNNDEKDITLVEGEKLTQGAISDITSYIMTGKTNVNPPVSAPRVLKDTTDRSGKFIFSKLPLEYAKLGDKDISMLTLAASKYAHYDSPVINVAKYDAGKVENIKINLQSKGLATVTVAVKDVDTNESIEANVTIDGEYRDITSILDNFKEYSSLESKVGSEVSFGDIISGLRTITTTKDGYYPEAISKTVYKDNENNVTVYLKKASALDDVVAPNLGLDSFVSDEINGIIRLELFGFDNAKGTLSKNDDGEFISELVIYDNGKRITPKVAMNEDGTIEVVITTPAIGENEIVAKLINPRGESAISPLNVDFYPSIGSIKGSVSNFTDDDANAQIDENHFVVVDLYDDKMNFIQHVMSDVDGSYMIPMAPIGAVYLKALQINSEYGTIEKESDFTNAVVALGSIKKANLKLKDSSTTAGWVPVVDYDPGISEADLETQANDNGGQVTIKGQVKWFDPHGQLAIMVNYTPYMLSSDDISEEDASNGSFNFTKDINLTKGANAIVVKALNPSGFYDTTPILDVKYGSVDNYTVNFKVTDQNGTVVPYATIDINNPESGVWMTIDTNATGEAMADALPYTGTTYEFDAYAPGYAPITLNTSDFATLDANDSSIDHTIAMNFKLKADTYIPEWMIEDVSYTQELPFDIPDGVVVEGKEVSFKIVTDDEALSPAPEHHFVITVRDDFGREVRTIETVAHEFYYMFDKTGNYEIEVADKDNLALPYSVFINVSGIGAVLPEPPVAPVIPTPSVGL